MQILIPYPLKHTCTLCGCSCMAQLVGPLSETEKSHIADAQNALASSHDLPPTLNPLMKGVKPDGSCLYFLNFPQKSCCFLDKTSKCMIHSQFGALKKPAACRRFPRIAIRTENDVRVAIKPYCYANYTVCDLQACDGLYETYHRDDEMRPILDDLLENAAFRPIIQSKDPDECQRAQTQEREILAWLSHEKICAAELFPALVCGAREKRDKLPKPFIQDVQRTFQQIAHTVASIAQSLGPSAYAKHVETLAQSLVHPIHAELLDDKTFWNYARYALHNAVFLRETTRFPDLSIGTFALSLGALAASTHPDNAANLLTSWFRIFAQTKIFETLFPGPQNWIALTRHLATR